MKYILNSLVVLLAIAACTQPAMAIGHFNVPDAGSTSMLLGIGAGALMLVRRYIR